MGPLQTVTSRPADTGGGAKSNRQPGARSDCQGHAQVPDGSPITQAEVDTIGAAQWDGQAVWAAGVPGAELITVPDTTHYIQNQRPDVVVAAVRQAIAGT